MGPWRALNHEQLVISAGFFVNLLGYTLAKGTKQNDITDTFLLSSCCMRSKNADTAEFCIKSDRTGVVSGILALLI